MAKTDAHKSAAGIKDFLLNNRDALGLETTADQIDIGGIDGILLALIELIFLAQKSSGQPLNQDVKHQTIEDYVVESEAADESTAKSFVTEALKLAAPEDTQPYHSVADPVIPTEPIQSISLLDVIKKYESNGNYDIANGGSLPELDGKKLTDMTISEIYDVQANWKNLSGAASSAMGAYQVINSTLRETVDQMGLDPNTTLFDETTQDAIAIHLLERRGLNKLLEGKISETKFMDGLAHEWASLPKNMRGDAAYGGTANNPHQVGTDRAHELMVAIKETQKGALTDSFAMAKNAQDPLEKPASTQTASVKGLKETFETSTEGQQVAQAEEHKPPTEDGVKHDAAENNFS